MGGKTRPRRWNGLFKRDPKSNDWLKNTSLKGFTAWNFKTALKQGKAWSLQKRPILYSTDHQRNFVHTTYIETKRHRWTEMVPPRTRGLQLCVTLETL